MTDTDPVPSPEIMVDIDEPFAAALDAEPIERAARRALASRGVDERMELSILITTDEKLRELNHQYRGLDRVTDVLSFSQEEGEGPGFARPVGMPRLLGDIVISYPRAAAQAAEAGWSTNEELAWLVVHGVLHLLGYTDTDERGRAEMWALGEQALGIRAPNGPAE